MLRGAKPLICVIISVRFKFWCWTLLSVEKTFHVYFFIVFQIMLENPAPPSLKFCSPWEVPPWKYLPSTLSPKPQKISLKISVHFPGTITICKHRSKFVTCRPSPGDCGGVSRPRRHSFKSFWLPRIKWLSENFDPVTLGKNERVRGPRGSPIFLVT